MLKQPRRDRIEMVGQRFGNLVVLAEAGYRPSYNSRLVRARCDCGKEWVTDAASIRRGMTSRCIECGRERNKTYGQTAMSRRVPGGRTLAQIAEDSGVLLNTVYVRWMRGWPIEKLGQPARRYGRRGC